MAITITPKQQLYFVGALSANRILFAILELVSFAYHYWWLAIGGILFAMLSDWADGRLARNWSVVSSFGMFFDPLSDKIFCLSVLWLLTFHISSYFIGICAVIITLYDVFTTTMRIVVRQSSGGSVPASPIAKIKTATLFGGLFVITGSFLAASSPLGPASFIIFYLGNLMLGVATLLTARSFGHYLRKLRYSKRQLYT